MVFDFQKIAHNPVLLSSGVLLLATSALILASAAVLINAFLYSPQPGSLSVTPQQFSGGVDPASISQRNFFGLAEAKPELQVENLPETELNLVLRGAFVGSSQETAGAIIENEDTKITDHYYVGEKLADLAELKAIYADRVVLERNGLLETLYFPDIADSSGIGATKNTEAGRPALNISDPSSQAAKQRREAIRERIRQLRKR